MPYIEITDYIEPKFLPSGLRAKMRKAGLTSTAHIHEHLRADSLLTLPGIGGHWEKKIRDAFTNVRRVKVSPQTVAFREAREIEEAHNAAEADKLDPQALKDAPAPPPMPMEQKNPCVEGRHEGYTTFSNGALTQVGRACRKCPITWIEDWSDR